MARGAEAKLRRRNEKKARKAEAERLLNEGNQNDFDGPPAAEENDSDNNDIPLPTPPVMDRAGGDAASSTEDDTDTDNDDEDGDKQRPISVQKSKARARRAMAKAANAPATPPKKKEGIKPLPLVMLILLTGTTVLPALLYAGDWFGSHLQKSHMLGSLGYKLGIGPTPKKRVVSFYEKHDPTKIPDVPRILSKHYGEYPKLVRRLERKYGDYGYFLNWENDEAPYTLALDKLIATRDYVQRKFDQYAPQFLKTAASNMKHNFAFLYRKGRKIWKKTLWPYLEPIFGVPEGTAAQKRKDAAEARARTGRKQRNAAFRDDVEEE